MADLFDEVKLIVDSRRYSGWKSIRIVRSIESMAGSFTLEVSDQWDGERDPWPIAEDDPCRVLIDDDPVISGFIDKRNPAYSPTSRSLSYSGRDRACELVDSSALVKAATGAEKWNFYNFDVLQVAREIAKPHGVPVSVQAGLGAVLTKSTLVAMNPGDTCFEVISKLAAAAGVLVVSDGLGGIVITRSGTSRATPLIQGQNILSASSDYDGTGRFYRYIISTQAPGSDEAFAAATNVQAEQIDEGVRRRSRVLIIKPDKAYTVADAKRRADWEARVRAAKSEKVTISVRGWRQPNGELWPVNALTFVKSHKIGVNGDLLISQVENTIDDKGRLTQLSLVRPDAFEPEPNATIEPTTGLWKELNNGGL